MDAGYVKNALIEVLHQIQSTVDDECPQITGSTKPVEDLPKFDSKMWPVAAAMVGKKLNITIANDTNLFCQPKTCIALTLDETVAIIIEIANAQAVVAKQAEEAK